jgi:polyhydroxyalkanoate synthesis repressor PhaR
MRNNSKGRIMAESILIRRTHNRRLYSTRSNSYVTLADLDQLIQSGTSFRVVDVATKADTTELALLEVLKERIKAGRTVITNTELLNLLRVHASSALKPKAAKNA